jgi:hypothetical protein
LLFIEAQQLDNQLAKLRRRAQRINLSRKVSHLSRLAYEQNFSDLFALIRVPIFKPVTGLFLTFKTLIEVIYRMLYKIKKVEKKTGQKKVYLVHCFNHQELIKTTGLNVLPRGFNTTTGKVSRKNLLHPELNAQIQVVAVRLERAGRSAESRVRTHNDNSRGLLQTILRDYQTVSTCAIT